MRQRIGGHIRFRKKNRCEHAKPFSFRLRPGTFPHFLSPEMPVRKPASVVVPAEKPGKEVSAMAWIEDASGKVLMVKQHRGRKLWALPGGKVRATESLVDALRREIREETGLRMIRATPCEFYDRAEKSNLTVLFRVHVREGKLAAKTTDEIESIAFRDALPRNSTPSLLHFWPRLRPPAQISKSQA